jgi:hydroxymethylglutaryl-CoA lyase
VADLPRSVAIVEEGPREGFQIEPGPIPTARKIELIDALARTGLRRIQVASFVNPKAVPGMADADQVVAGLTPVDGVEYDALWLNERGFERALAAPNLSLHGTIVLCASETFLKRNQNRDGAAQLAEQGRLIERYQAAGVPITGGGIMASFGCNFEGPVPEERVVGLARTMVGLAADHGVTLTALALYDTMAWASPASVRRLVGALRQALPELEIGLHLHDTRGLAVANAYAGLEMGVRRFDAAVAGLGGCPFAGHAGAAGNICTEDLVFLCDELGIATGIDLEALIAAARLAEAVVGHPLPGSVMRGGSLARFRAAASRP